jgi:(4S)-4-hydroxy-5-phosphonooxypentane-2,3-dione isomerase
MLVAIINVHVKPEYVEAFNTATLDNARNSIKEPGITRFDVYHQIEDPTRFMLVEIYKNDDAVARHRETNHYMHWRDTVADMMAEPRSRNTYSIVFPFKKEL